MPPPSIQTRERSGFGEGIYASHLFTLAWTGDVLWAWLAPARHAARPGWIDGTLQGFMAFMVFNATVVFETGAIRLAGLVGFALLTGLGGWRWVQRSGQNRSNAK